MRINLERYQLLPHFATHHTIYQSIQSRGKGKEWSGRPISKERLKEQNGGTTLHERFTRTLPTNAIPLIIRVGYWVFIVYLNGCQVSRNLIMVGGISSVRERVPLFTLQHLRGCIVYNYCSSHPFLLKLARDGVQYPGALYCLLWEHCFWYSSSYYVQSLFRRTPKLEQLRNPNPNRTFFGRLENPSWLLELFWIKMFNPTATVRTPKLFFLCLKGTAKKGKAFGLFVSCPPHLKLLYVLTFILFSFLYLSVRFISCW